MIAERLLFAVAAFAISAAVGAATISWFYWSPRLKAAEARATTAETQAERDRKSANDIADQIIRQNAALDTLRASLAAAEEAARTARRQAQHARGKADAEAQRTLAEIDPPGATELEAVRAAQAAFDADLARERVK